MTPDVDAAVAGSEIAHQFVAYQVCPDSRQLERDFLCMVASVESQSDHPIATEIVQIAKLNNVLPVAVSGLQCFPRRGLGGIMTLPGENQPRAVIVGSREFVTEGGLQIPELLESTAREWQSEPQVELVFGGWDSAVRGVMKFVKKQV
jgi:cation transport ATPase